MRRALVGIDGDHAFALLGADLQEGEAEFVLIDSDKNMEPGRRHCSDWSAAACKAADEALEALRVRLGATDRNDPATWITYALDESHPRYCP